MSRAPSPPASRSSSPFIPNATPDALPAPLSSSKRECFPVSPSGLISRSRAAGTTSFGSGLPLPNGPRRSSCSARSMPMPSRPTPTSASTLSVRTSCSGPIASRGVLEEVAAEGVDGVRRSSSPAAARCPPWRVRCSRAGVERGDQVEAGDAPRRAAGDVALDREQDRRPPVALGQPRGGDADDPGMPALAREHQRRCLGQLGRLLAERGLGRVGDLALGRPPLGVGPVEVVRDRRRPLGVVGQHQLDAGVGAVEPAGGVDPRGEPEAQRLLVHRLGLDLRDGHQRPHARARRRPHRGEALADEPAVLADQRDEVGDGRERDEVELGRGGVAPAPGRLGEPRAGGLAQGDRELVGHARPRRAR